ncbi:MAG TPA: hypothetical protein VLI04_20095 [Nocardioidaceae bacterium]|nr:hypothetical protein [Nocardioidaceae bacterium]
MKDLRRLVSTVVIVSFSLAALMGIAALLSGGSFGETEGRILLTTVVVGTESVAMLCYLALVGGRFAPVGGIGALVSLVAFGLALYLTWANDIFDGDGPWKLFGIAVTVAASLAQMSLLLALAGKRDVGLGLVATLLAIAVVAVMIIVPIVSGGEDLGDGYWRAFGVVAILDVLGTVVLTAVGAFRRRTDDDMEPKLLSAAVESRLVDAAQARGMSPSQLLSELLDSFITPR